MSRSGAHVHSVWAKVNGHGPFRIVKMRAYPSFWGGVLNCQISRIFSILEPRFRAFSPVIWLQKPLSVSRDVVVLPDVVAGVVVRNIFLAFSLWGTPFFSQAEIGQRAEPKTQRVFHKQSLKSPRPRRIVLRCRYMRVVAFRFPPDSAAFVGLTRFFGGAGVSKIG